MRVCVYGVCVCVCVCGMGFDGLRERRLRHCAGTFLE